MDHYRLLLASLPLGFVLEDIRATPAGDMPAGFAHVQTSAR
jgi:hypothetical protein